MLNVAFLAHFDTFLSSMLELILFGYCLVKQQLAKELLKAKRKEGRRGQNLGAVSSGWFISMIFLPKNKFTLKNANK